MAERDRLVEALATLDGQIAGARSDLQALARSDEQELCESRLIILQVGRRHPLGCAVMKAFCRAPGLPYSLAGFSLGTNSG